MKQLWDKIQAGPAMERAEQSRSSQSDRSRRKSTYGSEGAEELTSTNTLSFLPSSREHPPPQPAYQRLTR